MYANGVLPSNVCVFFFLRFLCFFVFRWFYANSQLVIKKKNIANRCPRFATVPLYLFVHQWPELTVYRRKECCADFKRNLKQEESQEIQKMIPNQPWSDVADMQSMRRVASEKGRDGIQSRTSNNTTKLQNHPKQQGVFPLSDVKVGIVIIYNIAFGIGYIKGILEGIWFFNMHSLCCQGYRTVCEGEKVKFQERYLICVLYFVFLFCILYFVFHFCILYFVFHFCILFNVGSETSKCGTHLHHM